MDYNSPVTSQSLQNSNIRVCDWWKGRQDHSVKPAPISPSLVSVIESFPSVLDLRTSSFSRTDNGTWVKISKYISNRVTYVVFWIDCACEAILYYVML